MGVVQIQADIQNTHKQADSKETYKHMKAQTRRQQADIQTHESTNKQTASRHTRHKKTTPDT